MISVPNKIKELLHTDSVKKNIRIHFPNDERSDICNNQIVQDSVNFTESINSRDQIKFGLPESSIFECEVVHVGNVKGATIHVYLEIYCDYDPDIDMVFQPDLQSYVYQIPYGVFVIKSCDRQSDIIHRKIVAYSAGKYEILNTDLINNIIASPYYQGSYIINTKLIYSLQHISEKPWQRVEYLQNQIIYYNQEPIAKVCYYTDEHSDEEYMENGYSENPYDSRKSTLFRVGNTRSIAISANVNHETYNFMIREIQIKDGIESSDPDAILSFDKYTSDYEEKISNALDMIETYRPDLPDEVKKFIAYLNIPHIRVVDCPYLSYAYTASDTLFKICSNDNISDYSDADFFNIEYYPLTSRNIQLLGMASEYKYANSYSNNNYYRNYYYMEIHLPASGSAVRIYKDDDLVYPDWKWWLIGHEGGMNIQQCTKVRYGSQTMYDVNRTNIEKVKNVVFERTVAHSVPRTKDIYKWIDGFLVKVSSESTTRTEYTNNSNMNTLVDFYNAYLELNGLMGRIKRDGVFEEIDIIQNFRITASMNLYPSVELYPAGPIGEKFTPEDYMSCLYSDENVIPFGLIKLTYTNTNNETISISEYFNGFSESSDENSFKTYTIEDNYILKNQKFTQAEITAILHNLEFCLWVIRYIPTEVKSRGLPYVESGDTIEILTPKNDNIIAIVFKRTLSGEQCLIDTYEMR